MRMLLFSLPILLAVTRARSEWKVSKSMKNELKNAENARKDLILSRSAFTSLQEENICDNKTSLEDLRDKISLNVKKVKQCSNNSSHILETTGNSWVGNKYHETSWGRLGQAEPKLRFTELSIASYAYRASKKNGPLEFA